MISDGTSAGLDRVLSVSYNSFGIPTYTRDSSPQDLDSDGINDINYSATKTNIQTVFNNLSGILNSQDNLFIFTTDHGGQENGSDVFINLWGEIMRDDELAIEINKVHPGKINIVMGQCRSGGFINDLSGNFRIIASACTQDQDSYAKSDLNYDEFLYHWISAICSQTPEGVLVIADSNNDGWISIREAFNFALTHDTRPETPQYNSSTAGLGCILKMSNNCYLSQLNPTLLCTSGLQYSVSNVPSGCTVSWSGSPNTHLLSTSGNTAIFSSTANANGPGFIEVKLSSLTCSSVQIPQYEIWAGTPQITNLKVDGGTYYPGMQVCPGNHWLSVTPIGGNAGSATWTVPYGIPYFVGTNTLNFTFPSASNSISISAKSTNSCGTGTNSYFYLIRKTYGCTGSYAMTIYPNPASDNITITLKEESLTLPADTVQNISSRTLSDNYVKTSDEATYTVNIYNSQSSLLSSVTRAGKSFSVPLLNMQDGTYIVEVTDGKNIFRQQVIVKRD